MNSQVESTKPDRDDCYLALVPRGLHIAARDIISDQLASYRLDVCFIGEPIEDETSHVGHLAGLIAKNEEHGSTKKVSQVKSSCLMPVGSVEENHKHYSLGYLRKSRPIWSKPGALQGCVWMKFVTNAPVDFIANELRVIGPILALVSTYENINLSPSQSLQELTGSFKDLIDSKDYPFSSALALWHRHVKKAWNLPEDVLNEIDEKMNSMKSMKYRLSCVRTDSEKYICSRQQMLRSVADIVVPKVVREAHEPWRVDLTNHDVEVVILMHPHSLVVGLTLRPYQHLGAKSFAMGLIPADTSVPYLSGQIRSELIRLRPSTAQILLHLAELQQGEIVLDPAAGIGTIPVETILGKNGNVGFGGDIVLTPNGLGTVAAGYLKEARAITQQSKKSGVLDLLGWDATNLPFRTSCIEAVVSDLPFGKKCMSSAKLDGAMPLMVSEMARVLRPGVGRMVLLCGHFYHVLNALQVVNTSSPNSDVILMPCDSVFPVNIGGLTAWVVIARRGLGQVKPIKNQIERVRKLTHKRERNETIRSNGVVGKKRTIQTSL